MRKRIKPTKEAMKWIHKDVDPDGFLVEDYGLKDSEDYKMRHGRGVKTIEQRKQGDFLLHYAGETVLALTGEMREKEHSTGFRFFFRDHKGCQLCVDASEETGRLGRLVNHGSKKELNAVMKCVEEYLVLFAIRDIQPGEELLYDYGLDDLPWTQKSLVQDGSSDLAWNGDETGIPTGNTTGKRNKDNSEVAENCNQASNEDERGNGNEAMNDDLVWNSEVTRNGDKAGNSKESGNGDVAGNSNKAGSIAWNEDIDGNGNKAWNGDETEIPTGNLTGKRNKDNSEVAENCNQASNEEEPGNGNEAMDDDLVWNPEVTRNDDKAGNIKESGNSDVAGNSNKAGSIAWNEDIDGNGDKAWNGEETGTPTGNITGKRNKDNSEVAENCNQASNEEEPGNGNEAMNDDLVWNPEVTRNDDKSGNSKESGNGDVAGNSNKAGSIAWNEDIDGNGDKAWNGDETGIPTGNIIGNRNKDNSEVAENCNQASNEEEPGNGNEAMNDDLVWDPEVTWYYDKSGNSKESGNGVVAGNSNKAGIIAWNEDIDGNGDKAWNGDETGIPTGNITGKRNKDNSEVAENCNQASNEEEPGNDNEAMNDDLVWDPEVTWYYDKSGNSKESGNGDVAGNSNKAGSIAWNEDIDGNGDKAWNGDETGIPTGNITGKRNKDRSELAENCNQASNEEEPGNDNDAMNDDLVWDPEVTLYYDKSGNSKESGNGDVAGNSNKAGSIAWNEDIDGKGDKAWNGDETGISTGNITGKRNKDNSEVAENCNQASNEEEPGNGNEAMNDDLVWDPEVTWNYDKSGNSKESGNGDEAGNSNKAGSIAWNEDIDGNGDKAWNGEEAGSMDGDVDNAKTRSNILGGQFWGSVNVILQGRPPQAFPMQSTVIAIGSSRSNDIIVKNATPHEAILEVNCHGEVFLVRHHEVKALHHKECFYVGGRQFKWCYPVRKDETSIVAESAESNESEVLSVTDKTDIVAERDESDDSDEFQMLSTERKEVLQLLQKYKRIKNKYKELKKAETTPDTTVQKAETTPDTTVHHSCSTTDVERKSSEEKKLACVFCNKLYVHRITEHWIHEHSDENEVAEIQASTGNKKKVLTQRLRNRGNFKHNIKVLQGGGDRFIPVKQSKSVKPEEFLPCTSCYGFYQAKELWRHHRSCPFNTSQQGISQSANVQAEARLLLRAAVLPDSVQHEDTEILERLNTRKDDIGKQIKGDTLILKMAKVLFNKLGSRRKNDISQRARQLARLKMEVNRGEKEHVELIDLICGKKYDRVVEAVHNLAGLHENEEKVNRFEKPGLALRIGHNLVKASEIKIGLCLRNDDEVGLKESETFLKLLKAEWNDSVSSVALATLKTNKFNKGEVLPLTEDLKLLKKYLDNRIQDLKHQFESPSYEAWRELAEVTLARILIFNKRRSAEASKLLLKSYNERPNWRETANQEIFDSLTELEQNMFDRMDMVETQGKMDKKVPTLFTSEMVDAIEMLNKYRSPCGIKEDNPYIFANQENGHLDSWQVLNKVAVRAGCEKPELINSVSLRKYIATVSQILDLNDGEVQWLSSHLAHTVKTHKDFYRLQTAAVEIGKVSKLLLLTENGDVSKFKGKSLEEIEIDDSIAFDKGDIEEEKGLYDIAEEDCLDEELLQEENSERNNLSNGGGVDCSRKSPQPGLNLSDQHSETNFRGVKRPSIQQHRHGSVKHINSPYHELNLNDIDSDDSQGDPTYMDKDSSSSDEESPPQISTKHYKQRWSPEELQTFNQIFSACLRKKLMPTATALKMAAAKLPKRTIPQIRTRVNNVIKGKQSS